MTDWNPDTTPNFSFDEFRCKCGCEKDPQMKQEFMEKLQGMRDIIGPMTITSGWRCRHHPEEAKKSNPGAHNQGTAADIKTLDGYNRFKVLQAAFKCQMQGVGVANSFIHVDDGHDFAPRPTQWKYG